MNGVQMNQWIDTKFGHWKRVQQIFQRLGFEPPKSATEESDGNYVANIVSQYQADLTPYEVRGIITFAITHDDWVFQNVVMVGNPPTLDDVLAGYQE